MAEQGVADVLRLSGVGKSFSGVTVLAGIDLTVRPGEVLGLLGENGAGKSTLIKILNGIYAPDAGRVELRGEEVSFSSPLQAIAQGIATVHQDSSLAPSLDVAGNLLLGQESQLTGSRVWLRRRKVRQVATSMLERSGLPLDASLPAERLSVGQRQMVEIARALSLASSVLILDEPTAALTPNEIEHLFAGVRRAAAQGLAVIFVTHRLKEVPVICDRVVVLRDGRAVGELPAHEATEHSLISMMLGRQITALFPEKTGHEDDVVLRVQDLSTRGTQVVSFDLRRGEILALTGVLGGGQREVARSIYGAEQRRGSVAVDGVELKPHRPDAAIRAGVVYVSGDRQTDGVMPNLSVERSLTLPELRHIASGRLVPRRRLRQLAQSMRDVFRIKAASLDAGVVTLSGGNQQKLLIARWLHRPPRVLLLDEPTLGVDVGSKTEIYALVRDLTDKGTAVLLVSSESQEALGLSDRILVMRQGSVVAELAGDDATEANVLMHALGVAQDSELVSGDKGAR